MKNFKFLSFVALAALSLAACNNQAPESDNAKVSDAETVTETTGGDSYKVDPAASNIAWVA